MTKTKLSKYLKPLENLKAPGKWIRLFFMVIFMFVSRFVRLGLVLMAALQFLIMLFTNKLNDNLLNFSKSLSAYLYDIMLFLTYASEERPFPFAKWSNQSDMTKREKSTLKKVN